jgi:hypothetical protein
MKRTLLFLLTTLSLSTTLAQEKTVIQYTDGKVTGVKNVEVPVGPAMPDFAQADVNGDGCVNQKEALNMGILPGTFKQFARGGCLNPQSYQAAAEAPGPQ